MEPQSVFISYCHESPVQRARVRALAAKLKECGIPEVYVDFDKPVEVSWPDFLGKMGRADKIIVVCDCAYVQHTQCAPAENAAAGLGTHAEWLRIETRLYEQGNKDGWLVPLLFEDGLRENVPAPLRAWQYEQVNTSTWQEENEAQFQRFWQRLHNTKAYCLPPASRERKLLKPSEVVSSFPLSASIEVPPDDVEVPAKLGNASSSPKALSRQSYLGRHKILATTSLLVLVAASIATIAALCGVLKPWSHGSSHQTNRQVLAGTGLDFSTPPPEVYNPDSQTWAQTLNATTSKYGAQLVLLLDGSVLAAGGNDVHCTGNLGCPVATAELYTPMTNTWTPTSDMKDARCLFALMLLKRDGTVLLAGGSKGSSTAGGFISRKAAQLYFPTSKTWEWTGYMTTARAGFQMVYLSDGTVLAAGGEDNRNQTITSSETYNPATKTWYPAGRMAEHRSTFQMVLLSDGTVLAAGGGYTLAKSSEIYSPFSRSWAATGEMTTARVQFQMLLLSDGTVLAAGGVYINSSHAGVDIILDSAELYDSETKTWTTTGSMKTARRDFQMVLLPDGRVLAAGGYNDNNKHTSYTSELYTPATKTWEWTHGAMLSYRDNFNMVLL